MRLAPDFFAVIGKNGFCVIENCGKMSFDLDSTVIRGDSSVKSIKIIRETNTDETEGELCIYINDLEENPRELSFKVYYGGVEYKYIPEKINSNTVICQDGKSIDEFIQETNSELIESIEQNLDNLESKLENQINSLNTQFQTTVNSIHSRINNLSVRIDMLNDKLEKMEDKNNGLEIM